MSESDERPLDRLAPDDLVEQVDGAETVDDAVERLHKFGESSTPSEKLKRCPMCSTRCVYPKPDRDGMKHRRDGSYRCAKGHHFDDPVYGDRDDLNLAERFEWVDADELAEPPIERQLADLNDRTLAALAIVLYAPWNHTDADPSHRDLAEVLPYSRNWIGKQIRAWRDGEYRDLVADPRPWRVGDV